LTSGRKIRRRVVSAFAAIALSVAGMVGLSATPALAHGCGHTNHWDYYYSDGHYHWATYNGYYNSNGVHWHLWQDVHGRYQSACY
jgi:hypothetical protein